MTPALWRRHTMANCELCPMSDQPKTIPGVRCPHCGERLSGQKVSS